MRSKLNSYIHIWKLLVRLKLNHNTYMWKLHKITRGGKAQEKNTYMWNLRVILNPHNNTYSWTLLKGFKLNNDHLHVEINCEVKSKQWRLHAKVTCEVEAKQWLEVIKCIVHVMTCLHLYLILVIISGCGNKSDYWGLDRIWAWENKKGAILVTTIYLRNKK